MRLPESPPTIADGARTLAVSARTLQHLLRLENFYEVSEEQICYWAQWLPTLLKVAVEPTSAVAMGGALEWLKSQHTRQRVLVILSGGNIDRLTYQKIWKDDLLREIPSSRIPTPATPTTGESCEFDEAPRYGFMRPMATVCTVAVGATLFAGLPGCVLEDTAWKDPSKHYVQFVPVDKGVELEVLDWGGIGRPVVLLAGFGNSAHVFDEFAEKLIETNRVYGITRRGFGSSSHPESGYDVQRLAQDIVKVLDALKIESPVLAGHSYAGNEMTILGSRSDRIAGLVFMDALNDPTYDWTERNAIQGRFPFERYPMPHIPRGETNPSFEEYLAWQRVGRRDPFPESEIHAMWETTPNGRMGLPRTTPAIRVAITAGTPTGLLVNKSSLAGLCGLPDCC